MSQEEINQALLSRSNENKLRFSKIGISNVDERIKMYFGEEYGIKIFSRIEMYTTVEVNVPILPGGETADA